MFAGNVSRYDNKCLKINRREVAALPTNRKKRQGDNEPKIF